MATKPLFLYNPDDGETYKIIVSEEDFERAQTDVNFAQSLLFHGIVTHSVNNNESATVEEETGPVDDTPMPNVSIQESSEEKHVWEYNTTIALIASMETHMEDLNHPVKKKHVYQNVANDLNSSGYAVNATMCQNKWKSLLRSYKAAVDNKKKTGRGPTRFHFFEQMDILLGEKPNSSCSHTLDSSNSTAILEEISTPSPLSVDHDSNSADVTLPGTDNPSTNQQKKRKRDTSDFNLLQQRQDAEKNHERRHQERMEISRMKLDLEERKLLLLEKIINKANEQ